MVFLIDNEEKLRKIGTGIDGWSLSSHYQLTADINLSSEWIPIGTWDDNGTSLQKPFTGTFDGNNKTISSLYINKPSTDCQGFFGFIDKGSVVKNLAINGSIIGNDKVGGVVVNNNGTIENCSFKGKITSKGKFVGGVAGRNCSTMQNCSFNGNITSDNGTIGGVAGINNKDSTVKNCSFNGNITCNDDVIGGVVGDNFGIMENCCSTGDVTGNAGVGGIAGTNKSDGVVKNCHSSGNVTGRDNFISGVVGFNDGTVENSYSTGNIIGRGKSTGGVAGGNCGMVKNSYSTGKIIGNNSVGGVAGDNTEEGMIENCHSTGGVAGSECIGGVVGVNFATLRNSYATANIDGEEAVGGVAGNNGGAVKDCYYNGNISGKDTIGGVTGINLDKGTLRNCYVKCNIIGNRFIGGIVGNSRGAVENCYFTGDIAGNEAIGGVAGINLVKGMVQGTVKNCYAMGNIASDKTAGGVVGQNQGLVQNCVALNASIIRTNGTDTTFGRMVGGNGNGTLVNNYSLSGMKFIDGTSPQASFPNHTKLSEAIKGVKELAMKIGVDSNAYLNEMAEQLIDYKPDNGTDVTSAQAEIQSWWTSSGLGWDFSTVWQWDSAISKPVLMFQSFAKKDGL